MPNDIQKIIEAGYQVKEFKPWHHHVYHDNTLTNIWHTSKKYMLDRAKGATVYNDIQEVINTLGKPTGRPIKDGMPKVILPPEDLQDFYAKLRGE